MPRVNIGFTIVFVTIWLIMGILVLSMTMNNITNVSAVEANGVGVYWDSNCNNKVFSIEWNTLTPGSVKNIFIYFRNEESKPIYLIILTLNWDPPKASDHMTLSWDYGGQAIKPNQVLQVAFKLSVSARIEGITNFSFDVIIIGSDSFPGDANRDGTVDVFDAIIISDSYGSKPGDPNWNLAADINQDNVVDILDVIILSGNFGKTA